MGGPPNATRQTSTAYTDIIKSINTTPSPRKIPFCPGTKLFTADNGALYPNIETDEGMLAMERFFKKNKDDLPDDYPTTTILKFMNLVFRNNMFIFGGIYWLQTRGKSMGTNSEV